MVFLSYCYEKIAMGLSWYFPFIAVRLLCELCCCIAVILPWLCSGIPVALLWACCGLAAASLWYRCGIVVELLWTGAVLMWDDILLWDYCLGIAVWFL